jgi:hypothetical protein
LLISLGAIGLLAPLAAASTVTYTSSAAFQAATNINLLENYGTLTDGQLISSGSTVDGFTYSGFVLTDGSTDLDITSLYHSLSGLDLGADHTASGSANTYFMGDEGATITFSSPVNAFGIFFDMDLNAADSYGFTDSNGDSVSVGGGSYDTSANTFVFAGLTSTRPFTSITFSSKGGDADYVIPEFEANAICEKASAVPEPASAQLLLTGIALLAGRVLARRRGRRR